MSGGRGERLAALVFGALLRLYPSWYRSRYGAEMRRLLGERAMRARQRSGRTGWLFEVVAAAANLAWNGVAERFASLRSGFGERDTPGARARRGRYRRRSTVEAWLRDARLALRAFVRNPAFAGVAVLTIALGIGANTAIFSVVSAVLLRPLPYPQAERLVFVWGELTKRDILHWPTSIPDLAQFQEEATLFERFEGVATFPQPITGGDGEPEQAQVAAVTPGFLELLGARPLYGRVHTESDATPAPAPDGGPPPIASDAAPGMVVLSHALWLRQFGGDPGAVGRSFEIGGNRAVVVGVLPADFRLYLPPQSDIAPHIDAWVAPRFDVATSSRNNVIWRVIARMKPGVTVAQAQAEMHGIAARIRAIDARAESSGFDQRVVPLHEELTASVRPIVLSLLAAVAFVLLIACANVSNLLLVRATSREREMAVRAAMGGSRWALVRQVFAESVLLALLGAVAGVALALGGIRILIALQPADLPRLDTIGIDAPVLAFAVAAAFVAAVLFGTLPALHASRTNLARSLRDRGAAGGGRAQSLVRNGIVVLEVALSLVLLIGAGLMLRSFDELRRVDPGFDAAGVLTFAVPLPGNRYETAAERAAFAATLRPRLAALPGVQSVSAVLPLPLTTQGALGPYGTEAAAADPQQMGQADVRFVHPGYFETMRTGLVEGRYLNEADQSDSAAVVVVDRTLARKAWPNESAVGKRLLIRVFTQDYIWVDVVGVVEHQRNNTLAAEGRETIYYPDRFAGSFGLMTWLVRTSGDPLALVAAARAELAAVDPLLPFSDVRPLQFYIDQAMGSTRFALVLIGVFGATALLLAAVGLYGVLAYTVRQRIPEIGVRVAFGARGGSILGMVVGQGMRLTALGVAVGIVAGIALTRFMRGLLVGVTPTDPPTFAGVAATFLAVAAIACWLPARRAARVDPLVALRED